MTTFLVLLAVAVFVVCVGVVEHRLQQDEKERTARRWDERERLLSRRRPVATPEEIRRRRARRG